MKRSFVLGLLLIPAAGFALDMTGCETIGYFQYTGMDCLMYDTCINTRALDEPDPAAACVDMPRTAEECARQIVRENLEAEKDSILMKCPVTDSRLADKNAEKDFGVFDFEFVSTAGTDIHPDMLGADDAFVYYLKLPQTIWEIVPWADKDSWAVIGQYEADEGLYMSIVK